MAMVGADDSRHSRWLSLIVGSRLTLSLHSLYEKNVWVMKMSG